MNDNAISLGKIISLQKVVDPRGNPSMLPVLIGLMMFHQVLLEVDMHINTVVNSLLL